MEWLKTLLPGAEPGTVAAFAGYLAVMVVIGAIFCRRSRSLDEYLLGGRGMGSMVTNIIYKLQM